MYRTAGGYNKSSQVCTVKSNILTKFDNIYVYIGELPLVPVTALSTFLPVSLYKNISTKINVIIH